MASGPPGQEMAGKEATHDCFGGYSKRSFGRPFLLRNREMRFPGAFIFNGPLAAAESSCTGVTTRLTTVSYPSFCTG